MNRTKLKSAAAFALCFAFAPGLVACDPLPPPPPASPSTEASTAAVGEDGIVTVILQPPKGEWARKGVSVDNAKIVDKSIGAAHLELQLERSKPKEGETTVEGANEPIVVTIQYALKGGDGSVRKVTYTIPAFADTKPGAAVQVDVVW